MVRPWPLSTILALGAVALLLVAAAATSWVIAQHEHEVDRERAQQQLVALSAQHARQLAQALDARLQMLGAAAAARDWPGALADPAQATRLLQRLSRSLPVDTTPRLVDTRGRLVDSGADVSMRRWFNAGREAALLSDRDTAPLASVAPAGAEDRVDVIALAAQPLTAADGQGGGLLVAQIDARLLAVLGGPVPVGGSTPSSALVDREGSLIAVPPGFSLPLPRTPLRAGEPARLLRSLPGEALLATHPIDGSAAVDALGWHVVSVMPLAADDVWLTDPLRRHLLWSLATAMLLAPLAVLAARRAARPLQRLMRATEALRPQESDAAARVPVAGPRETVALGESTRALLAEVAAGKALADDSVTGYRELFEMHPLPMWVLDEQTLRFLEVNAAAVRKYGWSRDELLSMSALDLRPPEAHAALREAFAGSRDSEHQFATWQHRLRSGETIDVEIASRRLQWNGREARIAAVRDVTLQHQATIEISRQRAELSRLAQRLMATEAAERRHLAQVLHDQFSPNLYGMKLSLESLLRRLSPAGDPASLQQAVQVQLAPVLQAIEAALIDVRGLMSDLRPPLLVDHGLRAALRYEVGRRTADAEPVEVRFHADDPGDGAPRRFDPTVEQALFMIAREALHNALLHARATHIGLGYADSGDGVTLTVDDNGCGFDARAAPPVGHLGLAGIRERAAWIGAALTIDSSAQGTRLAVRWQAPPAQAA